MTPPLSVRLREGTKTAHRLAENAPFIQEFFRGRLPINAYRDFLVQLLPVYTALEEQQERHKNHSVLSKIYYPQLNRKDALIQDLNFYFDDTNWQEVPLHQATQNYVHRIQSLGEEWPEGLVAHHYTRYLGDLSGGQALRRIVGKTYKLESDKGLAFYDFNEIADYDRFKNEYRSRLDEMPVSEAAAGKIVDEANHAFTLNGRLFESMMKNIK
ncbi:MAG: biliverdin-producing heme oxygenase [Calditrichia bacterium]